MSPPDPRSRAFTIPPTLPPGIEGRVLALEYHHGALERELEEQNGLLRTLNDSVTTFGNALIVMNTEKTAADKRREHFMKWVVGVAVGVSVTALGTLAAWVIHLQGAMASVGK